MLVEDVVWDSTSSYPEPLLKMTVDGIRVTIDKEQKFIYRGVYIVFLGDAKFHFTKTLPPMIMTAKEDPVLEPGRKKVLRGFTADREVIKTVVEFLKAIKDGTFWKKDSDHSLPRKWDRDSFMESTRALSGDAVADVAAKIAAWFEDHATGVKWGRGQKATFFGRIHVKGEIKNLLRISASGWVVVFLKRFEDEGHRKDFRSQLDRISGIHLSDKPNGPRSPYESLTDSAHLNQFLESCKWAVDQLAS